MSRSRFNRTVFVCVLLTAASQSWALDASDSLDRYGRQTWQTESGLPQNTVNAILQTSDGYLWFGTDGGLVRFDSYQLRVFDTQNSPGLGSNHIRALSESKNKFLSVVTAAGAVELRHGEFHPAELQVTVPQRLAVDVPGVRPDRVTITYRDRENTLWVGTDTGLIRVRNRKPERFAAGDPLAEDAILALYEDRQGDLWVGTDASGVTMLRDETFFSLASRSEGLDAPVRCVFADNSGKVWLGTDGSGLVAMRNGTPSPASFNRSLSSGIILALTQDNNGDLLAGTPDGLNRIRGSTVSVLTAADGLPEDFIRSIFVDHDGSLWISTRRGLAHDESGRVTTYTQANGLGSDLVGSVLRDSRGDLWAATLNGLSRFRNGSFSTFTVEDGLSSNIITDLYLDNQGELWVGTQGGGVDRLRGDSFVHIATNLAGPHTVYGIAQDTADHLWLAGLNGIFKVDAKVWRSGTTGAAEPYGTGDGLRVRECSSGGHPVVTQAADGSIWFAMARGVAELTASHTQHRSAPLPLVVEAVSVDTHTFTPETLHLIPAAASHVAFEYAALSFAAPQKVHYRYQLRGFDHAWIDAGARRTADYTNLPPGRFTFRFEAEAGDGRWVGRSFAFRVQPHLYQTWWFRILLIASVLLLFYAFYAYRLRQVQLQHSAVLKERNRIAREIHDTLAQGFVGVSVQLEVVARLLDSSPAAAREQLNEARTQVRRSISDARESIWELRSQSPDQSDFASRLSIAARRITGTSDAQLQFQVRGTYHPLPSKLEDELLRIGQEAVTNAVRHAAATMIDVEVAFDPKRVRLTVADNGCGFDAGSKAAEANGHFGLRGMRERAQNVGAEFQVTTMVGKGTTVSVEVPVR